MNKCLINYLKARNGRSLFVIVQNENWDTFRVKSYGEFFNLMGMSKSKENKVSVYNVGRRKYFVFPSSSFHKHTKISRKYTLSHSLSLTLVKSTYSLNWLIIARLWKLCDIVMRKYRERISSVEINSFTFHFDVIIM